MANKNTAAKGMTMTQKILADHAGLERVEAGQLIKARLDMVLGNDIDSRCSEGVQEDRQGPRI